MTRVGIGFWGGVSTNELIDAIHLADRQGFDVAYLIESFADVFGVLSASARVTERIELASGVATVFTRNPTTIAIGAATVDSISEGRFRLGLGVGHREIHRMRDDPEPARRLPFERPLRRLRETTEVVLAILEGATAGELVTYRGEIFEIVDYEPWLHPHRSALPIEYGTLAEKTMELGGEIADGVLPIFVPIEFVESIRAAVERGAERSGRDPSEVEIGVYIPTCVDADVDRARRAVSRNVATHMSSYRFYREYFSRRGFGDLVERVASFVENGELDEAAALVPEELIEDVAAFGPPERCHEQFARFREAGVTLPIVYPIHPEFRNYLPDPDARAGVFNTIEQLGGG
jgi:alkanesulfonate monooxygenase SsuD/methylene tetrahydromethanopterin reductase-like flavin-dependent oxidoreductase (luciferase family)